MINMAIIGFGRMGRIHADIINRIKDLNLVAVSKKNPQEAEEIKNKYNVEVYFNNDELLNRKDIDYAVIAATNEVHEEITVKAFEKGKNVIVEKPMGTNYESTLRMIKAAEEYKKNLFVYQSQRWDRDFLFVKDTIQSGKLGRILVIEEKVMFFGSNWAGWGIHGMDFPWRIKAEFGGGTLYDWGPHLVDHILLIMGKDPVGVYGILQSGLWSTEVDDHFFAVMRFDEDTICQIEVNHNCRIPLPRWYVIGTKGTLKVKGDLSNVWDEAEINYINDKGEKEIQNIKFADYPGAGLSSGFYRDFVKFLAKQKKEFVSMYEASKVIKILDMIKKSSEEKKYIEF